jgi:hypothetical protein
MAGSCASARSKGANLAVQNRCVKPGYEVGELRRCDIVGRIEQKTRLVLFLAVQSC